MARLSGKIAVVTGAGGGIGAAIAQRFAVEGAHVWVTDINGETAEETVRNIKAAGGAATAMSVDVSKGQDVTALLRNIENAHGYVDIVVNNAGILVRGEVRQLSDAEWTKLREVNLDAILRISRGRQSFSPPTTAYIARARNWPSTAAWEPGCNRRAG